MNPELRAQVEQLDVWKMTLSAREHRGRDRQTEEEKQLAWKAYYECELSKAKTVRDETGEKPPIYIPQCFKELAAENGIQTDPPVPLAKVERKPLTLMEATQAAQRQSEEVEHLRKQLHSKMTELENMGSMMRLASEKESELKEKISLLEREIDQMRSDFLKEKQEATDRSVDEEAVVNALKQRNASLIEEKTMLEREVQELKEQQVTVFSVDPEKSGEDGGDIERLRVMMEDAVHQSKKMETAYEEEKKEKEAILAKMKHAKQQFDKLRKQSHDRNIENEELKAEIERLKQATPIQAPSTTGEEAIHFNSVIDKLQQEKSDLERRCVESEGAVIDLRAEIENKDERLTELMPQLDASHASLQEARKAFDQSEADVQSVRRLFEQCQQELESRMDELEAVKDADSKKEEQLQMRMAEIEDLSEILDQKEQEMEALQAVQTEAIELRNQVIEKDHRLEEIQTEQSLLEEQMQHLKSQTEKLEQEGARQAEALGSKEAEISKLKEEVDQLQQEISGHTKSMDDKEYEISVIKSEKENVENAAMEQSEALHKREAEILKLKQEFHDYISQMDQLNAEIRQRDQLLSENAATIERLTSHLQEEEIKADAALREKEEEINQLAEKLQHSLTTQDRLDGELASAFAQLTEKETAAAVLKDEFHQEAVKLNQQMQEILNEREVLRTELATKEEETAEIASLQRQLTELKAACCEAQSRETTSNEKMHELDVALSEALEIAEMADRASRQAVEQKEVVLAELRSTQEQFEKMKEMRQAEEEAENKAGMLQMQLSRKEVEAESLKTRFQTATGQLDNATSELASVRHELMTVREQLRDGEHRLSEMSTLEDRLRTAEHERMTMQSAAEAQRVDFRQQLEDIKAQKAATEHELTSIRNQHLQLQNRVQELQNELQSMHSSKDDHQELQGELASMQSELTRSNSIRAKQKEEIELLKQQTVSMPNLQQKVVRLETALAIAGQAQHPKEVSEIQSLQQKVARGEAREAELYSEVEQLRSALEEARKQSLLPSSSDVAQLVGGMSNKKDEDRGYDVEAAVLSGGDPSGFQPLSGLLRGIPAMKYLSPCIRGADFVDRGFIFLMRQPALRYVLLLYFAVLHVLAFV